MGIFGAMTTAVAGLRTQSYALENISGNIANSQTTGYKRVDTSFVDLVPELPQRREIAGSVTAFSKLTNTIQGDLTASGIPTNLAISGEGYFVVQERSGYSGTRPVFNGVDLYTRRGDFQLDKDGYLVNGAGFYLRGQSIDPATGMVVGGGSDLIRISNAPVPARQTTEVIYEATLPTRPATSSSDINVPGSELFSAHPSPPPGYEPRIPPGTAPTGVRGDDTTRFISQSISGGAITTYNSVGTPVSLQVRWAKIDNTPGAETWNMYYLEDSAATGAGITWRNLGVPVTFDSSGTMTSPATGSVLLTNPTFDGVPLSGTVSINFGTSGLKQYSTANGLAQQRTLQQDGYPSGTLDSVSVTSDGRISGSYTNGRIVPVAQIPVVQFNADNALKRLDSGVYAQTLESGIPIIGLNGSTLIGGHLESSNTDIAEEFSKMIVTQQAYSANTRVVSTSQQMMSEIVNMVR